MAVALMSLSAIATASTTLAVLISFQGKVEVVRVDGSVIAGAFGLQIDRW